MPRAVRSEHPKVGTRLDRRRASSWAAAFIAFLASGCFAWSLGFNYGMSNQVAYLLGALRLINPTILDHDWYATSTTRYHPAFIYLSALLLLLDRAGWAVAIFQLVVVSLGMFSLYWVATLMLPKRTALAAFLTLLSICFVTGTVSVGTSYMFDRILQPSTLGSVFFLIAVPYFLTGRWLHSGIFLALSGLFHANFLVLSVAVFGMSHLLLQWRAGWHRDRIRTLSHTLLRQLGPALLVVLLLSPLLLQSAKPIPDGPSPFDILFKIRSPHHYVPVTFARDFMPVAGWQLIGAAAGFSLGREERDRCLKLGALLASIALVMWSGTLLTTAVYEPRVAQLFVWRLAPFSDVFCQLLACGALARALTEPAFTKRFTPIQIAGAAAGVGLLLIYHWDRPAPTLRNVTVTLLVVLGGAKLWHLAFAALAERTVKAFFARHASDAKLALPLVVSLGLLWHTGREPLETYARRSNLIRGFDRSEGELLRWMRDRTPRDSTFLSPPDMESVRYHGQRAIVVDWKSTPIMPHDVVEWFRRIQDVTGRPDFRGPRDLEGYQSLDQARLDALRAKYHVDYVLVNAGREAALQGKRAFANARFVVLKLDDSGSAPKN